MTWESDDAGFCEAIQAADDALNSLDTLIKHRRIYMTMTQFNIVNKAMQDISGLKKDIERDSRLNKPYV